MNVRRYHVETRCRKSRRVIPGAGKRVPQQSNALMTDSVFDYHSNVRFMTSIILVF